MFKYVYNNTMVMNVLKHVADYNKLEITVINSHMDSIT